MKLIRVIPFFACALTLFALACVEETSTNVPKISSFTPDTARFGALIRIEGNNFSPVASLNRVSINGMPCPVISASSTEIVIKAVPGVNTGKLAVTVDRLAGLSSHDIIIKPHKFNVDPLEGNIGDVVNITGSNFSESTDSIKIIFFYDSIPAKSAISDYQFDAGTGNVTFKTVVPKYTIEGNITIKIGPVEVESDSVFRIKE